MKTGHAVVVVGDDTTQLGILAGLLTEAGIEACTFASAEAALAAMSPANPPDLIVTDLYMPGIDGCRFCRLLRSPEYAAFGQVPILIVSATFAGDQPTRIAADVGADAFLPSPVDGKAFTAQVQALLSGKDVCRLPRVLIVENGQALTGLLQRTFTANGYQADVAFTVRQAEAALAGAAYDAAVLDYHLPDGTGDALLDTLRAGQPDCVCLMMAVEPTPELALSWIKRGAAAYLRKPFEPKLLVELCARVRRERALLRIEDLFETRMHELQEQQCFLRLVIDQTPNQIFWKDRNLTYLGCNQTFAAVAGVGSPENVAGMTDYDFGRNQADTEAYREIDRKIIESGEPVLGLEEHYYTADGGEGYVLTYKVPIRNANNEIVGVLGTCIDITERKRVDQERSSLLESERILRAQAEAANAAKDQFLAVLSHELRTPLTPVLAISSAVEKQPGLPDKIRADMEMIRRNVQLEARLIDDLLDLTRIVRGLVELHLEVVDAHLCLRRAMETCYEDIKAKHLEMAIDLNARPHHVWGDPTRLQQVFWNLIRNAVKFTPANGRIQICSSNEGDNLKIQVIDSGMGISPESLPLIFNAFEQAEQVKARKFGGLGLGLAIAKGVIDLHKGRLTAFSAGLDQGATFTVELAAVASVADRPVAAPVAADRAGPSPRLLLVEDHADTLRVLTRLLRGWGYEVFPASCVRDALELSQKEKFDLLVSDLGLPDGNGLDIMKQLKARYGLRGIAISGYGTEEDLIQSQTAGFERHLTKPVDFGVLETAIRRLTGRRGDRTG